MPIYTVLSQREFSADMKSKVVTAITGLHCAATGEPSSVVTVLFQAGYALKKGLKVMLLASMSTGGNSSNNVKEQLKKGLLQDLALTLELPGEQLSIDYLTVDADWIWEGGRNSQEITNKR